MTKKAPKAETPEDDQKKTKEGKQASKAAQKKAAKNKLKKESDKLLLNMASELPGNGGKYLLASAKKMDQLNADAEKIRLAKKTLRSEMKREKIVLEVFDAVMRMRKREPEEQESYRVTEALYTQQLEMYVSPKQKEHLAKLQKQKEAAHQAMADIVSDGDAGEAIGSNAGPRDEEEEEEIDGIPAENKALTPVITSTMAH